MTIGMDLLTNVNRNGQIYSNEFISILISYLLFMYKFYLSSVQLY